MRFFAFSSGMQRLALRGRLFKYFLLRSTFRGMRQSRMAEEIPEDMTARLLELAQAETLQLPTMLGSRPDGLTEEEAILARQAFGFNEIESEKPLSWQMHLWLCYKNPFNLLLTVLALVSELTGDMQGAGMIAVMVCFSTLLRFFQEKKSNNAAQALKAMVSNTATVLRHKPGGEPTLVEIAVRNLAPGDVVALSAGDMLPADVRILHATDLFISQAALTGESLPVIKSSRCAPVTLKNPLESENLCFMGTNVVSGAARAIIVAIGNKTCFGALAGRVVESSPTVTQFQSGVNKVSWLLIRFMMIMAPLVLFINGFTKGDWLEACLFALSVAVGLTPEMLPMIVTSTLAKGAVFLSRRKVIVKRLDAIQNLGAMNILCTDKTGTLTEDRIVLAHYAGAMGENNERVLKLAWLNSHYQTGLKNQLDVAVLNKGQELGTDFTDRYEKIDELPFDFSRRRMSVVVRRKGKAPLLICKGALEEVLDVSSLVRHDFADISLDADTRDKVRHVARTWNQDGLRVVAVATRELCEADLERDLSVKDERELTLEGYVAFLDPPKQSACQALTELAAAGVIVKMLTGDNELVALKVAREVGLNINPEHGLLMGHDLENMNDAELAERAAKASVFARLAPLQKERLVRVLRGADNVVGFMGDGINDAPALHAADIGISVNSAVDIAKEAADIILLENSLTVLGEGVREGRRTFANMLKYIKMTASSNFGNVFSVLAASAFLPFLPMLPLQLLIQNLLYDVSQTAIPFDNVDKEALAKPLRWNPDELGRFMLYFGPTSSVFDILTFLLLWFTFGANNLDQQSLFHSGWFVEGLLSQTLIVHMIRTRKIPFIQSRASWPLMLMTCAIMALGIVLPFSPLAAACGLTVLPLAYFPCLVLLLVGYVALTQVMKSWYAKKFGWH